MNATGRPEESLLRQAITALHTRQGWQLSDRELTTRRSTLALAWHHLGSLIGPQSTPADTDTGQPRKPQPTAA